MKTKYKTTKESRDFYDHTFPLHIVNDTHFFPAGQYSFPFCFVIGANLPGSFEKKWNEQGHECYGKIKYKLKAGFKSSLCSTKLFGKKKLVVDERYSAGQTNLCPSLYNKSVQGYCCSSHGTYKMKTIFNADKYLVGNTAILQVFLDTTEAKTDIKELKYQLIMKTQIRANGRYRYLEEVINEKNVGRIKAGESFLNENSISVELQINTLGQLQASVSGDLVKNQFYLKCVAEIDGCVCCDQSPQNKLMIRVFNKSDDFTLAHNSFTNCEWTPQIFNPYYAELDNQQFRMSNAFKQDYRPIKIS